MADDERIAALRTEEGLEVAPGVRVRLRSLADYRQNPENPVAHTPRNLGSVIESIHKVGAARSGFSSKGKILAGNLTHDAMAEAGIEGIIEVTTDGKQWVMVNREDLTPEQEKQAAYGDQQGSFLAGWELDQVLTDVEVGVDLSGIMADFELEAILDEALVEIGAGGEGEIDDISGLYQHDIESFKLAHRIEAAWQARDNLALDLFAGEGQLTWWYRRRFEKVVTVDKNNEYSIDYCMEADDFIETHLDDFMDFAFVDFDDEGTPSREIQKFFRKIEGKKQEPFILALTDGLGLCLKLWDRWNPKEMYLIEGVGAKARRATREDYDRFEEIVTNFVIKCAGLSGFSAENLSSYRGRAGNVLYQTWLIDIAPNPS